MFTKVSVLIPTRRRLKRLRTMLASYDRTFVGDSSELVFRTDDDDPETGRFLREAGHAVVEGPRLLGYRSLPAFFNEMVDAAVGDVFMCGNDDMVFQTEGWAPMILAAAGKYPDGLFDLGVATHNEGHFPFSVVSRKAVEAMGYLWDPNIYWGDMFLRDVMAHFGRTEMLPHVSIYHDWAGNMPDQVFLESEKDVTKIDPHYWTRTHAEAVSKAVSQLQVLR